MSAVSAADLLPNVLAAAESLRLSLRDADPYMLRADSQELGISMLHAVGKALVHGIKCKLPEFEIQLIADAARHAGNKVLGAIGDDFARNDMSQSNEYIQAALEAYLASIDEEHQNFESFSREVENFKTIAEAFKDSIS